MSYISLANIVKNSKLLSGMFNPVAKVYANAAGYRKLGLRYDDLIIDEDKQAQEALRRLPRHEELARTYRMRRAFQLSLQHAELPQEQQTKPEEDIRYFTPILDKVHDEEAERAAFDAIKIERK